jgi:predicted kinase
MKSLSLSKPHLIIVVGIPGSGKSFFADKFAATFNAPLVSHEKIAVYLGQEAPEADPIARDQLDELLKTKQSIIADGIADNRTVRSELARSAKTAGYETLVVWVQTDPATARSRSGRKSTDTYSRVLKNEDYDHAARQFTPPTAIEKPVVISGKHTYATQAKVVLKKLSEPRANISKHVTAPVRPSQDGRRNITIR